MTHCDNRYCESEAVKAVPVSVGSYGDETRNYCTACETAYSIGAQHATYRAAFRFAEALGAVIEIPRHGLLATIEDAQPTMELVIDSDDVNDRRSDAQEDIDREETGDNENNE